MSFFPTVLAATGANVGANVAQTSAQPTFTLGGFFKNIAGGVGSFVAENQGTVVSSLSDILNHKLALEKAKALNKLGGNPAPTGVPAVMPGQVLSHQEAQARPFPVFVQGGGSMDYTRPILLVGGGLLLLMLAKKAL